MNRKHIPPLILLGGIITISLAILHVFDTGETGDHKIISIDESKAEGTRNISVTTNINTSSHHTKINSEEEDIRVELRERTTLPVARAAELLARAKGAPPSHDGNREFLVYLALKHCAHFPLSADALEMAVETMKQTSSLHGVTVTNYQEAERTLRTGYEYCSEIVRGDIDNALDWLNRSADQGNVEASLEYTNTIHAMKNKDGTDAYFEEVRHHQQRGAALLKYAAEQGSIEAQYWLGMDYFNGVMNSKDYTAAYAYLTAAKKSFASIGKRINTTPLLNEIRKNIHDQQITDGERWAEKMLSSAKCCIYYK